MRRPLVSVVLLYAGGVLLGRVWAAPLPWLFIATALALLTSLLHRCRQRKWLALALVLAGWTNLTFRASPLSPQDLRQVLGEDAEYVTIRGRLAFTPEERGAEANDRAPRTLAVIQAESLHSEERDARVVGRIMVTTPGRLGPDYYRGRSVTVTGVLRRPQTARAKELFDYRDFLAGRGIHYELQCGSVYEWSLGRSESDPAGRPWSDQFQTWARSALERGLPEGDESVRLLWAMILGWRAGMPEEVANEFRHSGTMHLFAISGLHVGMITIILVALCRTVRVPRGLCWTVVIPALWFYAAATGWQASAVRATLMSSLVLAGWSLRRPQDLLNSLAGAAWLILLFEPRQLFQVGYQLSFSVVLSIVLMLPHLDRLQNRLLRFDPLLPDEAHSKWDRRWQAALRHVTGSLGISVAATLGSMPWMAHYFNICTPVSLLANLAVVPLAAVALMSGLGSLLTAAWFPDASVLYNHSAWLAMGLMCAASRWSADLPGAWFHVASPSIVAVAGYYLLLIAVGTVGRPFVTRSRIAAIGIGTLLVVGSGLAGLHSTGMRLTVLPLRGGDSLFIDAPGSSLDLLVDTGDARAVDQVVRPFLRARGINRLPNLLLTHGDVRHVGGATVVREEFRVGQTITGRARSRSPAYRALIKELEATGSGWREVERGDRVCGWRVLHPAADDRFSRADDNALVLLGEFEDVRILLSSDLGRLGQRTLLDREPGLKVDVIIASMPNPDEPLSDGFLRLLEPRLVVVSAGEYPASERPSRALRDRLRAHAFPIFFTCDHGAVYLTLRDGQWRARAQDGREESGFAKGSCVKAVDGRDVAVGFAGQQRLVSQHRSSRSLKFNENHEAKWSDWRCINSGCQQTRQPSQPLLDNNNASDKATAGRLLSSCDYSVKTTR